MRISFFFQGHNELEFVGLNSPFSQFQKRSKIFVSESDVAVDVAFVILDRMDVALNSFMNAK